MYAVCPLVSSIGFVSCLERKEMQVGLLIWTALISLGLIFWACSCAYNKEIWAGKIIHNTVDEILLPEAKTKTEPLESPEQSNAACS